MKLKKIDKIVLEKFVFTFFFKFEIRVFNRNECKTRIAIETTELEIENHDSIDMIDKKIMLF